MGKLVPFDRKVRQPRPRSPETVTGQIVLFTGVRYERTTDAPDSGKPATPARKRKRG